MEKLHINLKHCPYFWLSGLSTSNFCLQNPPSTSCPSCYTRIITRGFKSLFAHLSYVSSAVSALTVSVSYSFYSLPSRHCLHLSQQPILPWERSATSKTYCNPFSQPRYIKTSTNETPISPKRTWRAAPLQRSFKDTPIPRDRSWSGSKGELRIRNLAKYKKVLFLEKISSRIKVGIYSLFFQKIIFDSI